MHYQYNKIMSTQLEQMNRESLLEQLASKDAEIEQFRAKQENLINDIRIYKIKLEEQIEQNQKSIKTFAKITEDAVKLVNILQQIDEAAFQNSLRISSKSGTVIKMLRQSSGFHQQSISFIEQSDSSNESIDESQINYMEQIIAETLNIMQYLIELSTSLSNNVMKPNNINQLTRSNQIKEVDILSKEIVEKGNENKILKYIIENLQQQKIQILKGLHQETNRQKQELVNMEKQQLINLVIKLIYKIREMDKQKRQSIKTNRANIKIQRQKYEQLLRKLKQVKKQYNSLYL